MYKYIFIHIYMCVYTYIHTGLSTCVCMCAYTNHLFLLSLHTHIRANIYISMHLYVYICRHISVPLAHPSSPTNRPHLRCVQPRREGRSLEKLFKKSCPERNRNQMLTQSRLAPSLMCPYAEQHGKRLLDEFTAEKNYLTVLYRKSELCSVFF